MATSTPTADDAKLDELLDALYSVRDGDFSVRLNARAAEGKYGEIAAVFNQVLDHCEQLSDGLQRVGEVVSTEGRLTQRVSVVPAKGAWGKSVASLNQLLDEVSEPMTSVAQMLDAVANGDLSQRVDLNSRHGRLHGDLLRLATSVNRMADQMSGFTVEVTRVAREVGTEGKLGGSARVEGVSGAWRDVTEAVNQMAARLTAQVRDISTVTVAVSRGDLSRKVTVDVQGEMLQLKDTVNTMVDQLSTFADEVTRVAREVGTEGKLGGRANVKGVSGIWKDLTNNVNSMADNLTNQVRDISQVTTAVARGDLSRKVTVDVQGEMLALKNTVNTMVDQLDSFADEVTRVAREVGTEGKLGGRANVKGVSGIWKDLTDNVNSMANSLTYQVRNISQVTTAVARGDLTKKITVDAQGEMLQLKDTVNTMVDQLDSFADEVTRMAREVGTEGKLGGQAHVRGVSGVWKDLTDNVNSMANNLTHQVRQIAVVTTAVARGDLTKKIAVNAKGEILELKDTINVMVDQLSAFADEVTRVAREVGTEGKLGGRANVKGVSGIWKDLTENVNSMSHNLTSQVRNISQVTAAVAAGDLSKNITVDAQGEMLELKDTINTMVAQLSTFALEVTRVAHEVGSEGQLGGQAKVDGVSGTWKQLTDSVNELARNLTTQVRAISSVASAVTRGDLTQSIQVEASGEVATLKDNVNLMVANLRETTAAQRDEDWLKSNVARISGLIQGHRDLNDLARLIMTELTPLVEAQHGACFLPEDENDEGTFRLYAGYGYQPAEPRRRVRSGTGLAGEVIAQKREVILQRVPGDYVTIESGLGAAPPLSLAIFPILSDDRVLGVIELASYSEFREIHINFLRQLVGLLGTTINTILANSKTEYLLAQSQQLTTALQERSNELQRQQEELRRKNAELHSKAGQLASQNRAIELQNRQIERARRSLEDRAHQLQVSSKYKSEFLANMSHELRTPLNSLLILARLLADNTEQNLTSKQVEFAQTIHKAGSDLLQLIDEILDLSKVEAGRMEVSPADVSISQLVDYVEAAFRPMASDKGLAFAVEVSPDIPNYLWTDEQRLQQVLRNLLSNAVKFTNTGEVRLLIEPAWALDGADLDTFGENEEIIAFSVADTGIGIPHDKLQVIFEAFHQGDGGTSRRFGGTGLGLSISRNMAELIGGEIRVQSTLGEGTTFTLLLPVRLPESPNARMEESVAPSPGAASAGPARIEPFTGLEALSELAPADADEFDDLDDLEPVEAPEPVPALREPAPAPEGGDTAATGARTDPERDAVLEGRRVLIVDDDIRNVFALTSALEAHGLEVLYADNGHAGIDKLESNEDIALVLMDIMMPELDGNATTRAIREMPQFADLPIISLTAKAMQGDRERSLDAGASDYVTKPVDLDHLLDVMRTWLDRSAAGEISGGRPDRTTE
ncbi:HAMP domain-containing protein [Marinitenerispora sediminis]|uniref:Circadian input-output histidine kinase CikA n=1 Tax=Marinitenerispora sediminis TaxID=1931232 RepID=A0A368T1A2_9ACTN|nr:HAMP domain-containing protein [Marinitenerispora sediminis]RCV51622.1 hybrid sensor histidine kinase/response regulator [Marinitenerispora sediminis]RCV52319.1 hybrid sensor histidine kinase/response regulator [Marinitenerispora sediminis]RCV53437.1 hybrid sensor histidine kinase/response regulator [Marinitenerispora sediminis]